MPEFRNNQTPVKERTSKIPESKLSLLTKTALTLGTLAVVNISYSPIRNYFNQPTKNQIAKADSLFEPYDATPDLDGSYPLSKPCPEATHLSGKALGIALENCGKELNWTQEEIDYENEQNRNMFAMLFLFWLDMGGGSPKPSAFQIDFLATQISKTPKQSATFKSSTGWRESNPKEQTKWNYTRRRNQNFKRQNY